jgi:hypothetical protein
MLYVSSFAPFIEGSIVRYHPNVQPEVKMLHDGKFSSFKFSSADKARLQQLAETLELTQTDVLRSLIRAAHRTLTECAQPSEPARAGEMTTEPVQA